MANIFNFEIDGASYSYDSEIKNSLGNSMLKKVLNKETAEIYAAGNKPIKTLKIYSSAFCVPKTITLRYIGDLDFKTFYVISDKNGYNLANPVFSFDAVPESVNVSGGKSKIISYELEGNSYETNSFGGFKDVSNLEKKTFNGYSDYPFHFIFTDEGIKSGELISFEYYGNISKQTRLFLDTEFSKKPEDSGEDFFFIPMPEEG